MDEVSTVGDVLIEVGGGRAGLDNAVEVSTPFGIFQGKVYQESETVGFDLVDHIGTYKSVIELLRILKNADTTRGNAKITPAMRAKATKILAEFD